MNYVFEGLFKLFSLTAIHNEAVTYNWSEKYRKLTGPTLILIIIMIVGWDCLLYAVLSPVIILCLYYSFGDVKDFIASCVKPQNAEDWMLLEEGDESGVEEETIDISKTASERIPNTMAFVCGSTFTYLQFTFPGISFTLSNDMELDSCGVIELTIFYNEIMVTVSDGSSQYRFTLVGRDVSECDKEILTLFFNKTDKTSFAFVVRDI